MASRILSLWIFLLIFQTLGVCAQEVRVLFDQANPPFMYATGSKAAGIYPALVSEAFSRMDCAVSLEALPWKRALVSMDEAQAGVAGIYKTEERLQKYDYSDPLFEETILVVSRADTPIAYSGVESLRGKIVGVMRGWTYGDEFENALKNGLFRVEEADGDGQNLEKLRANRLDAMLCVREGVLAAMAAMGASHQFSVSESPFSVTRTYLAFSKKADRKATLEAFNAALSAMRKDGAWEKIVSSILAK